MIRLFYNIIILLLLSSCAQAPKEAREASVLPPIYPDYAHVTVPVNIAPLNFLLREPVQEIYVRAESGSVHLDADCSGNEATFPLKKWKKLLQTATDDSIVVRVWARTGREWIAYQPFPIYISPDSIDGYLTYRLIEPDYEVFSRLQIRERNIQTFDERILVDYNMVGNRCMNCHTYGANRPDLSFLYVRGPQGGMIINRNGQLRKLDMKTAEMAAGSVYGQFSPTGRYIAFSSNVIIPGFHSKPSKRLEVFDTKSDVYIADLETNQIIHSPLLADSLSMETFPCFSPDGHSLYFCTSPAPEQVLDLEDIQYHLCRIDFDETNGTIGTKVDTVLHATKGSKSSVCHPRISPDGRYLLYTVADYGTFPIWHTESDQRLLDLERGTIDNLNIANSTMSDTYHSWSSNSRWFVFASKRDDGMYGKPYFCHIDADGHASKPFVLPQKYPTFYDNTLKSFNVPELGMAPVAFDAKKVATAMQQPPESCSLHVKTQP